MFWLIKTFRWGNKNFLFPGWAARSPPARGPLGAEDPELRRGTRLKPAARVSKSIRHWPQTDRSATVSDGAIENVRQNDNKWQIIRDYFARRRELKVDEREAFWDSDSVRTWPYGQILARSANTGRVEPFDQAGSIAYLASNRDAARELGGDAMDEVLVKATEAVELAADLLPDNGRGLFALRVEGHSMADALIEDGDVVVLRRQETCGNGETVAVWLKEQRETAVGRYYVEGDDVRLQPPNKAMEPIFTPASNVEVQGRLVVVIRPIEHGDRGFDRTTTGTERGDHGTLRGDVVSIPVIGQLATGELIPVVVLQPTTEAGLVGPDGRPLDPDSQNHAAIIGDLVAVSDELLRWLGLNPRLVYELSPRRFEEVVAELLHRQGYEVTLTRATKDGGVDIYAARNEALGSFLYVVECKRFAPSNRVGPGLVQRLHGVVQARKATAGILATTSFFTKEARRFEEKVKYQLSLRDHLDIVDWLRSNRR